MFLRSICGEFFISDRGVVISAASCYILRVYGTETSRPYIRTHLHPATDYESRKSISTHVKELFIPCYGKDAWKRAANLIRYRGSSRPTFISFTVKGMLHDVVYKYHEKVGINRGRLRDGEVRLRWENYSTARVNWTALFGAKERKRYIKAREKRLRAERVKARTTKSKKRKRDRASGEPDVVLNHAGYSTSAFTIRTGPTSISYRFHEARRVSHTDDPGEEYSTLAKHSRYTKGSDDEGTESRTFNSSPLLPDLLPTVLPEKVTDIYCGESLESGDTKLQSTLPYSEIMLADPLAADFQLDEFDPSLFLDDVGITELCTTVNERDVSADSPVNIPEEYSQLFAVPSYFISDELIC